MSVPQFFTRQEADALWNAVTPSDVTAVALLQLARYRNEHPEYAQLIVGSVHPYMPGAHPTAAQAMERRAARCAFAQTWLYFSLREYVYNLQRIFSSPKTVPTNALAALADAVLASGVVTRVGFTTETRDCPVARAEWMRVEQRFRLTPFELVPGANTKLAAE